MRSLHGTLPLPNHAASAATTSLERLPSASQQFIKSSAQQLITCNAGPHSCSILGKTEKENTITLLSSCEKPNFKIHTKHIETQCTNGHDGTPITLALRGQRVVNFRPAQNVTHSKHWQHGS